jgi:hypothetical protein
MAYAQFCEKDPVVAHFWSILAMMRMTRDVRDYEATLNDPAVPALLPIAARASAHGRGRREAEFGEVSADG